MAENHLLIRVLAIGRGGRDDLDKVGLVGDLRGLDVPGGGVVGVDGAGADDGHRVGDRITDFAFRREGDRVPVAEGDGSIRGEGPGIGTAFPERLVSGEDALVAAGADAELVVGVEFRLAGRGIRGDLGAVIAARDDRGERLADNRRVGGGRGIEGHDVEGEGLRLIILHDEGHRANAVDDFAVSGSVDGVAAIGDFANAIRDDRFASAGEGAGEAFLVVGEREAFAGIGAKEGSIGVEGIEDGAFFRPDGIGFRGGREVREGDAPLDGEDVMVHAFFVGAGRFVEVADHAVDLGSADGDGEDGFRRAHASVFGEVRAFFAKIAARNVEAIEVLRIVGGVDDVDAVMVRSGIGAAFLVRGGITEAGESEAAIRGGFGRVIEIGVVLAVDAGFLIFSEEESPGIISGEVDDGRAGRIELDGLARGDDVGIAFLVSGNEGVDRDFDAEVHVVHDAGVHFDVAVGVGGEQTRGGAAILVVVIGRAVRDVQVVLGDAFGEVDLEVDLGLVGDLGDLGVLIDGFVLLIEDRVAFRVDDRFAGVGGGGDAFAVTLDDDRGFADFAVDVDRDRVVGHAVDEVAVLVDGEGLLADGEGIGFVPVGHRDLEVDVAEVFGAGREVVEFEVSVGLAIDGFALGDAFELVGRGIDLVGGFARISFVDRGGSDGVDDSRFRGLGSGRNFRVDRGLDGLDLDRQAAIDAGRRVAGRREGNVFLDVPGDAIRTGRGAFGIENSFDGRAAFGDVADAARARDVGDDDVALGVDLNAEILRRGPRAASGEATLIDAGDRSGRFALEVSVLHALVSN